VPRGLTRRAVLACFALCALAASGTARAPFDAYVASHPGTSEDDLLLVTRGDSMGRVLAVLHHPDAGYRVKTLRVRAYGGPSPREVDPATLAGSAGDAGGASYLVEMTQECIDRAAARRDGVPFSAWLYLADNRLAAWDLQTFDAGCRPEPRQVEASDHTAMRAVGEQLYRPAGRGRFRYGALAYEDWDDAFAAPTRASALALLQKAADERPADAPAQLRLAVALHAAGDRDGAIGALRHAAELDPRWALPHENLAVAYRQRGEHGAAERELALARDAAAGVASGPPAAQEVP
jgi:hypothetical protein